LGAVGFVLAGVFSPSLSAAQSNVTASPQALITAPVDDAALYVLKESTRPLARQYDAGAAPESMAAERLLLLLKRKPRPGDCPPALSRFAAGSLLAHLP